jgi:hypothetical protein
MRGRNSCARTDLASLPEVGQDDDLAMLAARYPDRGLATAYLVEPA